MGFFGRSISFDLYFFITIAFIGIGIFGVERALNFSSVNPRIRQAVGLFVSLSIAFLIFSIILFRPFSWSDNVLEWRKLWPSSFLLPK